MLHSFTPHHHRHLLSSNFLPLFSLHSSTLLSPRRQQCSLPAVRQGRAARPRLAAAQLDEPTASSAPPEPEAEDGPVELPFSTPSIFATTDDPTPLQVATSVLLTGAITVFLFRSVRRRAKRAKELKFRSSGAKKTLKEEALDSLKVMGTASVDAKAPPSPVQTLIGGITAGVIAIILYKFTTTIESALNRQTLSDNFSVRQITITVRTIVNGLCYLATFVFGINSVGLLLYSGQLALNSSDEDSRSDKDQLSPTGNGAEESDGSDSKPSDDAQ